MSLIARSEAIMVAADAYARAFREHGHGNVPREKRDALKEEIRAAADDHQGAVKDFESLRETVQNILDAGYHYPEEYRDSLEEALDAYPARGGSQREPYIMTIGHEMQRTECTCGLPLLGAPCPRRKDGSEHRPVTVRYVRATEVHAVDTSGQVHVDALSEALGDISNDIDGYVPVAEVIAAVLAARDGGQ